MMKKILVSTIFLLLIHAGLKAQAPTTLEEYTYVIVGYKLQLNMKLDMKKGYSLKDVDAYSEEDRKIEFKALYRDGEKAPCAIMMIYYIPRAPGPEYYCIPTYNAPSDIWEKYYGSIASGEDNPQQRLKFFSLSISRMLMKMAAADKEK
jgi:hypothetical protein